MHTYTPQTIRLTDGESFQLLKILNTTDIHGWYTLTYLAFDPGTRNVHTMSEDRSHMVRTPPFLFTMFVNVPN